MVKGNMYYVALMKSLSISDCTFSQGYNDQILWIQKCIKRKADEKEKRGKLHSYHDSFLLIYVPEFI